MSSIRSRYWRIDRRFFYDSERWGSLLPTTTPSTLLSTIEMRCFTVGRGPNLIVLLGIAMIFDRILIARLLFSLVTVGWGVLTVVADFSRTHATNAAWTPHARFHVVWQVLSYLGFGLLALALIWWLGPLAVERLYFVALMAAIVYAAFFVSLIAMPIYDGAAYDENGYQPFEAPFPIIAKRWDANIGLLDSAHYTCGRTRGGQWSRRGLINGRRATPAA